jgi:hypothetical protein
MIEDFLVTALVWLQHLGLWLLVGGPYMLGIVAGVAARLGRLWWAAAVEGYNIGVGNG